MIAYNAKVVLYNGIGGGIESDKKWYSTELTSVRVELTQGDNITTSGLKDADVCTIKVYDKDLPKRYAPPAIWQQDEARAASLTFDEDSFFIITHKPDIGADVTAPTGEINDADYEDGLQEFLTRTYGLVFRVTTADHYSLIPHWHISGR